MGTDLETTVDAFLDGAIEVVQPVQGGHRAGMDALLLAATVDEGFSGRIADFGAGCGVAGMAVAHRCAQVTVDLVEIDAGVRNLALEGVQKPRNSHISNRLKVVAADLTASINELRKAGLGDDSYDAIIANPPFNGDKHFRSSPGEYRQRAHRLAEGDLEKWVKTALTCLKGKGSLTLILRPALLPEILPALGKGFGSIVILPVHPKQGKSSSRMIIKAKKGGRGALEILSPFVLHHGDGSFTPQADDIFKGRIGLSL